VKLQKELKYELVEPEIPLGVIIKDDMLNAVGSLRYANHDLTNMNKFPKLAPNKYKIIRLTLDSQEIIVEPKEWVIRLEKTGILNLF